MPKRFNVRIYGLLLSEGRVLLSDEFIRGMKVTKFPGGGLEYGEGPVDCLVREFREELDLEVTVKSHFYTTDFFVQSAFDPDSQVISIYYVVDSATTQAIRASDAPHSYAPAEGAQSFRWHALKDLSENDLTLVIDKKVAGMLRPAT